MRVRLGAVADIPTDHCTAIADGHAVVVRVGDELRCFRNVCVHQDAPIAGGLVRNGILSCPLHFWRYRVDDGQLIGARRSLQRFTVETDDEGVGWALLPDPAPPSSLRDTLLARARTYDRQAAFDAEHQSR